MSDFSKSFQNVFQNLQKQYLKKLCRFIDFKFYLTEKRLPLMGRDTYRNVF